MQHPPTLKASVPGKQKIKEAIRNKGWKLDIHADDRLLREATKLLEPERAAWWEEQWRSGVSMYAAGVAPATRKRFQEANKRIKADIFKIFCQVLELPWQDVAELESSGLYIIGDPPDLNDFYGRTWYLRTLRQWVVQEQARLVVMYGQAGIGKTSLVRQFVERVRTEPSQFQEILWLTSGSFLPEILPEQAERSQNSISMLFELLKKPKSLPKSLIILDGWTEMLGVENYPIRYQEQDYNAARLLQEIRQEMLKRENSSCLVLIGGNEKLKNLDEITDEGRSKLFRSLRLEGMGKLRDSYNEFDDDRAILAAEGLHGEEGELRAFLVRYSNPSDLKSVAKRARNVFGGRISPFVNQYSVLINADVDQRLERQWVRLTKVEKILLYWLAVRSELCFFERLEADLSGCGIHWDSLIETLNALIEVQALVKRDENLEFKLDSVWQKFIAKIFVREASEEIVRAIREDGLRNTELFLSIAFVTSDVQDERIESEQIRRIVIPVLNELIAKLQDRSIVREGLKRILALFQEHESGGTYGVQNIRTLLSKLDSQ